MKSDQSDGFLLKGGGKGGQSIASRAASLHSLFKFDLNLIVTVFRFRSDNLNYSTRSDNFTLSKSFALVIAFRMY